jgi:hypothetical protein
LTSRKVERLLKSRSGTSHTVSGGHGLIRGATIVGCVSLLVAARSFAATQVSNLSEPYTVGFTANGVHFAHASSFVTDAASYVLQSVTVAVRTNSMGSSELRLRADSGGSPGVLIQSLGTQSITGDTLLTYNSGGTPLSANTRYWVTLGETGSGDFTWKGTTSTAQTGAWTIGDDCFQMAAGSGTWTPTNFGPPNESALFSIDATGPATSAYYTLTGGGAQLEVADAPMPLQAATGTGTMFPPLLIAPNPNPGKALIKQTTGADPKKMTIPPGVLLRKSPGTKKLGVAARNGSGPILQVQTNVDFSAPAAATTSPVLEAGGRTGAAVATFAAGTSKVRYVKTKAQFGGPAQAKVVPLTPVRLWLFLPGMGSSLPCKHPAFGGVDAGCRGLVMARYPAPFAAPGAFVGFSTASPGAPQPSKVHAFSIPAVTGLVAMSAPLATPVPSHNMGTSFGFPWTTGMVTISAPAALGSAEKFFLTGMDSRVNGVGTISLVSGALSTRAFTSTNANRGWLRLTVPEPGALIGAAAALAALAVVHHLARRRAKRASD